jgi:tetratricopeptide (TPR) repeat protein
METELRIHPAFTNQSAKIQRRLANVNVHNQESTMSKSKIIMTAAACFLSVAMCATGTMAFPGGSTSEEAKPAKNKATATPNKSPKAKKCKRSETVKSVMRKGKRVTECVKLKAEVLPDNEMYQNARMLADEGEYEWALDHLRLMTNQNDAEVLNYTGYSNRKAGRLETGIAYYHKALAINPNYVQAREYLGEAYVLAGRVDLAKAQLLEIGWRCGTQCETYRALEAAIATPAN